MTETLIQSINLTEAAQAKVAALLAAEDDASLDLHVAVQPGGCAGLRYSLWFGDESDEGDVVTDFGSFQIVVDRFSAPYLEGATIDFMDTIQQQGFTIDNPNATGSCACGNSFS